MNNIEELEIRVENAEHELKEMKILLEKEKNSKKVWKLEDIVPGMMGLLGPSGITRAVIIKVSSSKDLYNLGGCEGPFSVWNDHDYTGGISRADLLKKLNNSGWKKLGMITTTFFAV